jgi:hypothetical protein
MDEQLFSMYLKDAKRLQNQAELVKFLHTRLSNGDVFRYSGDEDARLLESHRVMKEIYNSVEVHEHLIPSRLRGSASTMFSRMSQAFLEYDVGQLSTALNMEVLLNTYLLLTGLNPPVGMDSPQKLVERLQWVVKTPWDPKEYGRSIQHRENKDDNRSIVTITENEQVGNYMKAADAIAGNKGNTDLSSWSDIIVRDKDSSESDKGIPDPTLSWNNELYDRIGEGSARRDEIIGYVKASTKELLVHELPLPIAKAIFIQLTGRYVTASLSKIHPLVDEIVFYVNNLEGKPTSTRMEMFPENRFKDVKIGVNEKRMQKTYLKQMIENLQDWIDHEDLTEEDKEHVSYVIKLADNRLNKLEQESKE